MQNQSISPTDILPAAIQLITRELRPSATPKKQAVYDEVARVLAQAQRQIERRYRREGSLPAMNMGITPPAEAENLKDWGLRLRLRRESAGLTRSQLAALAGVADSTIRNLETGRHRPTRPIVMRLQAVPALGIPSPFGDPSSVLAPRSMAGDAQNSFACNCWFAPEYDSIKMARDMMQALNANGGHVEQTYMYIDAASAAAWCAVTEQDAWLAAQAIMPISEAVRYIKDEIGEQALDVIALGPGEAREEVRVVQTLVEEHVENVRLFLLDISQPLLSAGYKHAAQVLGDLRGVEVYAIQGNFHNLPRYTGLFQGTGRRLCCMFGGTFSNLDNELMFLRNTLSVFSEGDMLLLNLPTVYAPANDPAAILQRDRVFARRSSDGSSTPAPRMQEFVGGVFKRHVRGLRGVRLEPCLDTNACPVPGSYAVDVRAHVRLMRGAEREFSTYYSRRYDPEGLNEFMAENGWKPVRYWRYAADSHARPVCDLFLLYRKNESGQRTLRPNAPRS